MSDSATVSKPSANGQSPESILSAGLKIAFDMLLGATNQAAVDDVPRIQSDPLGVADDVLTCIEKTRETVAAHIGVPSTAPKPWPSPATPEALVEASASEVPWIMRPLVARGQVTGLSASPKSGKSLVMVAVTMAIENKRDMGALQVQQQARVGALYFEDSMPRVARRLVRVEGQLGGASMPMIWAAGNVPEVQLPRDEERLKAEIRDRGLGVLVIDVAPYTYDDSIQDENSASQMQRWCASVRRIVNETGAAVVLVCHSTKGVVGRTVSERQRGSGTLGGLYDIAAHLSLSETGEITLEVASKDAPPAKFTLSYDHDAPEPWSVEECTEIRSAQDAVLSVLREAAPPGTPGKSAGDVAKLADVSESAARKTLQALSRRGGLAERLDRPGKGGGSVYRLRQPKEATS